VIGDRSTDKRSATRLDVKESMSVAKFTLLTKEALTNMNRRELLKRSAAAGFIAAVPFSLVADGIVGLGASGRIDGAEASGSATTANSLKPPKSGAIPVAYPLSLGVVNIDFTGPWAIFGSVMPPGGDMASPFSNFPSRRPRLVSHSFGFDRRARLHFRNCSTTQGHRDSSRGGL
jgi:hypothetical protein